MYCDKAIVEKSSNLIRNKSKQTASFKIQNNGRNSPSFNSAFTNLNEKIVDLYHEHYNTS